MPIGTPEETLFNRQNMDFDRQSLRSVGRQPIFERPGSDIKKTGIMKKMKTMKKKFFVLRSTSSSGPARLEYYDSEKKFKSGQPAKHPIHLHTCFNINKKSDSRHGKYGIVLFTTGECFTFLTESEDEQNIWLSLMLEYQDEYLPEGYIHKEHYDHVWQVTVQPKGLGLCKGSKGPFRLCLNSSLVSLVKPNGSLPHYTIQLVTIRSVAHNDCSFRMEVGKYAPTGEGEFWFSVEDSSVAKDMHETLLRYMNSVKDTAAGLTNQSSFRSRTGSQHSPGRQRNSLRSEQQRPSSCYQTSSGWSSHESPSSPNYPQEIMRARTNTGESRKSYTFNHQEDSSTDFSMPLDIDQHDTHISVVPEDMSPPSSPGCLDEQVRSYMEMEMKKNDRPPSNVPSTSPGSSSYLKMGTSPFGQSYVHKEVSSSIPDTYCAMGPGAPAASQADSYLMMGHHQPSSQMSAPIPIHSFSESHHPSPLPTVREGGSNEGYLPMDISNSPASSSGILRPEPAKCMLSDDTTGLPPRTYSLGSRPLAKKEHSYIEMGPRNSAGGNDMSRATSAPHIINKACRQEREHNTDSPSTSASPLSMSLKSDDSDSFMEYMSMRPRTASDSYNYRPRTSSFGKLQPMCRPRSASHGQGTRPFQKFSKLAVEQSRISQDPTHRTSMESSLQGSFDSLRVSNESLRKTSQEIRKKSGSNASDYAEMRGTPSPQLKLVSSEPDGYVNMQPGTAGRKSSPHRIRSDSSGSGRRPDIRTNSSDWLQQQTHLQQIDDYTEMAPTNVSSGGSRDSYMNMDYGTRQSNTSDVKLTGATLPPSLSNDSEYMTMELDSKKSRSDTGRSVSMENVDTYVMYDPSHSAGNKQRTGSLGSKDKQIFRPTSSRKPSSVSMSSCSPSSSSIIIQQQPSVSTSTRTGGSSDSIRKASRQSSMEKYSLGKDFRKKSGSTGSRPSSAKLPFSVGKDQNAPGLGIMPVRKPAPTSAPVDDLDDEYIEFSPTATKSDNSHQNSHHPAHLHSSVQPSSHPSRGVPFSSSGGFSSAHPLPSPAEEEAYTLYNPAPQFTSKTVHFQPQKPPPPKLNIPSSSSAKQGAAKDAEDYVGFEPGPPVHSVVSPSTSHRIINEAQEYVEYQPATALGYFTFSPSLPPHESSRADGQEYVGYEPGPVSSQGASKPVSPNSVMSYIKGSSSVSTTGKPKQSQVPKQQQTFSDLTNKTSRVDAAPGKLSPSNGTLKTEPPFKEGQIFTFPGNSQWSSPSASSLLSPNAAQPPPVYVTNAQNLQHPGTDKVGQQPSFVNMTHSAPFSSFSTAPPFPVSSRPLSSDPFKHGPHSDTAQQSNNFSSKQPKPPPLIAGQQTGQQCLPKTGSSQQCLPAIQSGQPCLPATQSGQPCLPATQSGQPCLPATQSGQPCLPATQSGQPCSPVIQSGQQCLPAAQSCLQSQNCSLNTVLNEEDHYVSYNPAQSGSFKSPKEDLAPETPLPSACLLQGAQTFGGAKPSVFTELTIDTGVENSFQGNVNQPQKNLHGYHRQTSAPALTHPSQALDTPRSNPTAQQPQVTSDSAVAEVNKQKSSSGAQASSSQQPMSPIPSSENSKRHKHLSGSSTSDAPSPSASTSRRKHPSGSSTSSQKSRKASTDSEKSISKGSKSDSRGNNQSDSNSSLNLSGGKTKRRMPSGDKSPGSSAEKSPMSPTRGGGGGGEFFCGEASPVAGKDLEAKMAVVKAKIQQSFGDVSGMVSSTSKDGHGQSLGDMTAACRKDGHGLIRPGSTPCMQSLDAAPDVSRSAGDTPNFSSRSCCLQFSSNSRTRHSIPDLGNYQQINFASSSGLMSTGSEQKVNTSSSNSGSGESCGSTHSEPAFKPLIYVKLDLGGSEGQGDSDLKVPRIKSRNSSDADEKQPPLSYAQIDFVKSQNLNKGKSMTTAGGDSSTKS